MQCQNTCCMFTILFVFQFDFSFPFLFVLFIQLNMYPSNCLIKQTFKNFTITTGTVIISLYF